MATSPPRLAAVPDDADDAAPLVDPTFSEITDTHLAFNGAIGGLALDQKSGALKVTLLIDTRNEVSHRDFLPLRHRMLEVTVAARSASGAIVDPTKDPVAEAVHKRRVERMMDGWLEGPADAPVQAD